MNTAPSLALSRGGAAVVATFEDRVCYPFLLESQNADDGWGYHSDSCSAVEPASLALVALHGDSSFEHAARMESIARGLRWLCSQQLPDGSWPAFPGQPQGCWVTALACLALNAGQDSTGSLERGARWLCDTWPAEGGIWQTIRNRLITRRSPVRQNSKLRGWSWTSGTASWVEPTACSVLALKTISARVPSAAAEKRVKLAEAMLYDRMCPAGGWNSGNPLVYGVPGVPRAGPTCWALLALRSTAEQPENQASLRWLERVWGGIQGPVSLAMAHFCLRAYGRPVPPFDSALEALFQNNEFFQDTAAMAWAAIALNGRCASLLPAVRGAWRQ
jgi:hypothetical protein